MHEVGSSRISYRTLLTVLVLLPGIAWSAFAQGDRLPVPWPLGSIPDAEFLRFLTGHAAV